MSGENDSLTETAAVVKDQNENLWDDAPVKRDSTVPTPKEIATVKQMFDSASMLKFENSDPFKGSNVMNRTRNKD